MRKRWAIALAAFVALSIVTYFVHQSYRYPYGRSHRCSKILPMELERYADEHGGSYPSVDFEDHLGLDKLISPGDLLSLERVVGKAGDAEEAKRFFDENGFLLRRHSSWKYVSGLSSDSPSTLALAWDKIPLGHNGQRTSNNSREVIYPGGIVDTINQHDWNDFMEHQRQ